MKYKSYIFVDTGAWYAMFDSYDSNHEYATQFVRSSQYRMVTSNYVVAETINLAVNRSTHSIAVEIGENLYDESVVILIRVTENDEKNAFELFKKYKDKGFSFTDCTSFVLMERLGLINAFAFDKHFKQYGMFTVYP
ncbi:MAG: type II toxin-antitoxin system VapC family toxin [Methanosarcinales archaeon]